MNRGDVVEVLDANLGWTPAVVLGVRAEPDGSRTYDVSVRLKETVHLGDVAAMLSVMCGGSRDAKVEAALPFFCDGDEGLSLAALRAYLTSVFKVLFEARPTAQSGATAKELGALTARRAFAENGVLPDGRLAVAEFRAWYAGEPSLIAAAAGFEEGLEDEARQAAQAQQESEVKRLAQAFSGVHVEQAFERLACWTDASGRVSRSAFTAAMATAVDEETRAPAALRGATQRLFDVFDTDGDGSIDCAELAAGLSVVCGGDRDEKVRAAFELFDVDGDGHISEQEMARYLTAVFRVALARDDELAESMRASPEELGAATARHAMQTADKNQDGVLSFEEFAAWYGAQYCDQVSGEASGEALESLVTPQDAIAELSQLLRGRDARELYETLEQHADSQQRLQRSQFYAAFEDLLDDRTAGSCCNLHAILWRAFELFDANDDGTVDAAELAAGLGALCGGARDAKVRFCFELFDADGDGYVDEEELRAYLVSVFRVTYGADHGARATAQLGCSTDELASATAERIMCDADGDADGRISYDEFDAWFTQSRLDSTAQELADFSHFEVVSGAARMEGDEPEPEHQDDDQDDEDDDRFDEDDDLIEDDDDDSATTATTAAPSLAGEASGGGASAELRRARRLLGLEHFTLDEIVEIVVEVAPRGSVTSSAFAKAARRVARLSGELVSQEDAAASAELARCVFCCFDVEDCDDVDFVELASGLASLSNAPMEAKLNSAFALFDAAKGQVSFDELRLYLLSVYRVLYAVSPTLRKEMDATNRPVELAHHTATQCFKEAGLRTDAKIDTDTFTVFVAKALP